jgi:ATP-dependent exoDNAse (exonuclease V) alpha subunit
MHMASYHLEAKIIGRSDKRSAVACAAYRAGANMKRDEDGKTHRYSKKGGVVSADLLTPDNAPDWARDRSQLWNAVEAKETRKNSQLAREIVVALPHELTQEQSHALVLEWAQSELVDRGMCADVCIHDPDTGGKNKNRHAHIMCTVREFEGDDWSPTKNREWNDKAALKGWRETWAEAQNAALRAVGSSATVDHRSLEDQRADAFRAGDVALADSLDRLPEPRLGLEAGAIEKRAMQTCENMGINYVPVTRRGMRIEQRRSIRERLLDTLSEIRAAALRVFDPFSDASPEDALDDATPGL